MICKSKIKNFKVNQKFKKKKKIHYYNNKNNLSNKLKITKIK